MSNHDKQKYNIIEVKKEDYEKWDTFVEASPQGTIFSLSAYLKAAVDNFALFWITKGDVIKAGLSLVLNEDGTECILDDLVIYNGIMFSEDKKQKPVKARLERFEITEFIVNWLTKNYRRVELALAPQFEDIRPFLWFNYHSPNPDDRFRVDVRHTSYLDISSLKNDYNFTETALFRSMETLRQRNLRKAYKERSRTLSAVEPDLFIDFYREMMTSQGNIPESDKLNRMKRLIATLIQKGLGAMWITYDGRGKEIYSIINCWDKKRAYYLFGAPAPRVKCNYKGTVAFWNSFLETTRRGYDIIDLEGVNSPRRGWFKLSFGGDLRIYYELYWRKSV